jgi:hypothetical protein
MRHLSNNIADRSAILPTVLALLLTGCGGGSGDSGTGATPVLAPTPIPTSTQTSTAPPSGASTALKDNTVTSSATFSNFQSAKVSVPVESVAFVGARRFVKVARADGATLFLGEVAMGMPFSMTVDAPLGQRRFSYEIFSESANDTIVRGEVTL